MCVCFFLVSALCAMVTEQKSVFSDPYTRGYQSIKLQLSVLKISRTRVRVAPKAGIFYVPQTEFVTSLLSRLNEDFETHTGFVVQCHRFVERIWACDKIWYAHFVRRGSLRWVTRCCLAKWRACHILPHFFYCRWTPKAGHLCHF